MPVLARPLFLAASALVLMTGSAQGLAQVQSQSATTALANCLADNTNGKERKELASWVFGAMSVHPDIAKLGASVNAEQRDQLDRRMAEVVTKLVTRDCVEQTRALGNVREGMRSAFESLGRLAMLELMSDPGVNSAMSSFQRHLDSKAFEAAFSPSPKN